MTLEVLTRAAATGLGRARRACRATSRRSVVLVRGSMGSSGSG